MNKRIILLSGLVSIFSFSASATKSVDLEISPGTVKTVKLPYEYKHLTSGERKKTTFIPERFYTVLDDAKDSYAIAGPLQPCVFVALRNDNTGKAVIFHKHFSNSVKSLITTAQKELDIKKPEHLSGRMFTVNMPNYDSFMKSRHKGKTQREEVKFIKDRIVDAFKIKYRRQIKAMIYKSALPDYALGGYELAELNIFVDSHLTMKSICIMHEGLFDPHNKSSLLSLAMRVKSTILQVKKEKQRLLMKHFNDGSVTDSDLNTYNKVHFVGL